MLSTSDPLLFQAIHDSFQALTWMVILVGSYLLYDWITDDDEPDGFT